MIEKSYTIANNFYYEDMKFLSRDIWHEVQPSDKWVSDCPFCQYTLPENYCYVIWEGKHWFIAHNKYPILWLSNMFLAIPYRHVVLSKDLSDEEALEFREVEKVMREKYGEDDYFMFVREWVKPRSIEHIHYHFVPGRLPYHDIELCLKKQGFENEFASK